MSDAEALTELKEVGGRWLDMVDLVEKMPPKDRTNEESKVLKFGLTGELETAFREILGR